MPAILASMAGLSALLLIVGLFRPNYQAVARRRIISPVAVGQVHDDKSESFVRRVLGPAAASLSAFIIARLPGQFIVRVEKVLETGAMHISVQRFMLLWVGVAGVAPTLAGLLMVARGMEISDRMLQAMAAWVVMGAVAPWVYIQGRAKERVASIEKSLPDAVDLIVTNVESGLALQAAMLSVAQRFKSSIADEFGRVIRETSMGRPREEAIEAMAERVGSKDLELFARAISQAARTGIPIGKVLRSQAIEIRRRRRALAREQAGKIPIKMTILTVAFMFPTLFMVLLGPVALSMSKVFAK
jgi:tight adherence protein C